MNKTECTACGKTISNTVVFCRHCGASACISDLRVPTPKKSLLKMVISFIFAVFAALILYKIYDFIVDWLELINQNENSSEALVGSIPLFLFVFFLPVWLAGAMLNSSFNMILGKLIRFKFPAIIATVLMFYGILELVHISGIFSEESVETVKRSGVFWPSFALLGGGLFYWAYLSGKLGRVSFLHDFKKSLYMRTLRTNEGDLYVRFYDSAGMILAETKNGKLCEENSADLEARKKIPFKKSALMKATVLL